MSLARIVLAIVVLCLTFHSAWAAESTGRQIMERQKELHEAASERSSLVMVLVDRKGGKKTRVVRSFKKTLGSGLARSLMVFTEPADLDGTSILSVETEPGKGSQWIYLPASKKLHRLASRAKTDYFMGTDLTYEDMETDDLESFELKLTGSSQVDGQDCWVVEAVPATDAKRKKSGYSKRIFHVRKDITFTLKVEFFDRRGRPVKTQTSHALEKVRGNMWVARKVLVDNSRSKHKTLLGLATFEVDVDLPDEIFTERFVAAGRRPQAVVGAGAPGIHAP